MMSISINPLPTAAWKSAALHVVGFVGHTQDRPERMN